MLTRFDDLTDTSLSRQRITQRLRKCMCGCQGRDPWHRATLKRVVRDLEVLSEPELLDDPKLMAKWGIPVRFVVALGTISVPWSETGSAPVRAIRRRWDDGSLSIYIDWELVELK